MRRSHHPDSRGAGARSRATRVAALIAVFLQAFVLQTHVHTVAPLAAAGYERTSDNARAALAENPSRHEAAIACALCQAQSASRALPPSSQALVAESGNDFAAPAPEIRRVSLTATHSWQSRAPPAHL